MPDYDWKKRLQQDHRRVLILDDDPTGTQTMCDVDVILCPSRTAYRRFLENPGRAVFVLTNTRALPKEEAVRRVRSIKQEFTETAREMGISPAFILRGDSTLRGHIFDEIDVFSSPASVGLFVPAFPECGRITKDGIHYLLTEGKWIPVCKTEFARDTVFGYESVHLEDWVAELSPNWKGLSVPLAQIRERGSEAVSTALLQAAPNTLIIPDAETRSDLECIAAGLLDAEEKGADVVVRSSSTFAAIRSGLHSRIVKPKPRPDGEATLIVIGSHTQTTTEQLNLLCANSPVPPRVLNTKELLRGQEREVARVAQQVKRDLQSYHLAIVATERIRKNEHADLSIGARVMDALTSVVKETAPYCSSVIAKGGITSAQVATDGLGASHAHVEGQLSAGISLWQLHIDKDQSIPYAVIPGNVGNQQTMLHIAQLFGAANALDR